MPIIYAVKLRWALVKDTPGTTERVAVWGEGEDCRMAVEEFANRTDAVKSVHWTEFSGSGGASLRHTYRNYWCVYEEAEPEINEWGEVCP
jgi:hypothetical protein